MADLYDRLYGTPHGAIPGSDRLSPAFRTKVGEVARRLRMDPQHLLTVMSFETGGTFDPAVKNRAGSGATGLIQFMPSTARALGTTTDALARMRPEEQLDYVEQYLKPYAGRMRSQQDAYMAVLYPQALGKPASHVLFQQGTRAYEQNKGLDPQQTGQVTIGDTLRTVGRFVRGALTPASAEASPLPAGETAVSPARSTPAGGRGEELYQRLYGTTPAAPSPAQTPAAPPPAPGESLSQRLYGTTPAPAPVPPSAAAPAPSRTAPPAAPPQSLLGRIRGGVADFFAPIPQENLGPTTQAVAETIPGFEFLGFLPQQTQEQVVAATPETVKTAANVGLQTGMSALGTAMGGPVGTVFGSGLGYGTAVALGLEEPSLLGAGLAVGVPAVVAGGKPVTKAVVKRLPGASTAMHQEVADRLTAMKDRLQPPVPSSQLYDEAAVYNPPITASAVSRDAAAVLAKERALQPSLRNPQLVRIAEDLQTLTQADVPMEQLYANQQRVGELVREFRTKGGVGEGRIKQLYAAFHEDLETAAGKGIPGAQELKNAIAASRKEHVAAEIDDLFQPGKAGITIDPEGRASINGGRLAAAWKAKLRRDKTLSSTLSADEKAEIGEILTLAQRLKRLSPPQGATFGSGQAAVRAAAGSLVGGPAGAAIAVAAPDVIAKAMQTRAGRALVKKALQEGGGQIEPAAVAGIATLIRQQLGEPPAETRVPVTPPGPAGTYQGP